MTETQPPVADDLQNFLNDLGADIDLSQEGVDVGFDELSEDRMEFTEATIVKPVIAKGSEPVGEVTKEVTVDGNHAVVHIQKRPECPNCQYVPTQEEDAITLTGRCIECGVLTCANCGMHCFSCDRPLCDHHSDGYGMMGEVLCPKHRRDIEREKEIEWKLKIWQQHIDQEDIFLDHETQREIAFREIELDAEIQRHEMELEAEIKRRQQRLAEFEAKSEHWDKMRKRNLEEQKHELDKFQTMLEERRKATRLALDEEIERKKQALDEWEAHAKHKIKKSEQALKERQQDQKEYEFDKEHEFEREKFDRTQGFKENKFEKKHQLERDDKYAKRDIEQQKVEIQRKKAKVDSWVKKRRQKLKEYQVKNQKGGGGNGASWNDIVKTSEGLEQMPTIEVKS